MHFLKYIKLNNYLNLKHATLEGLKDLNIIIGPNNCGKTSLLKAVDKLSNIDFARYSPSFICSTCTNCFTADNDILSVGLGVNQREKYLTNTKVNAIIGYDTSEIEKVLPDFSETRNKTLESAVGHMHTDATVRNHLSDEFGKERLVLKERAKQKLIAEHISPIIWNEIKTRIFNHILFCPDERLQSYKEKEIPEYINSKNLTTSAQRRLIEFLSGIVDPKIIDLHHSLDLVRGVENQDFTTSIAEQGSGVKSLICLVADILSERQAKILLIDEPELGLNPSGKHAFLEFLLEQTRGKQIFLATHDPTFVNPVLWKRENVSVYLFSMISDDFVKVNLVESKQDPNTFAGFLPHTTSLKQVHIYVEGTYDVYNFQIFLDKYAKRTFKKDWYRVLNKVGIYHLGGDFWSHLLYTIPKRPYISLVILDGDKKSTVEQVIERYTIIEKDRFQVFESLEEIVHGKHDLTKFLSRPCPCPIYCLKRSEIEDYLEPRPSSKEKGPLVANKMGTIPSEIKKIFDVMLELADIKL